MLSSAIFTAAAISEVTVSATHSLKALSLIDETSVAGIVVGVGVNIGVNVGVNVGLAMVTVTPDGGDGVTSTSFGLGAKYYMNNIYGGGSYNSFKANADADAMANLLIEAGYLYGLSDNVFLDAGFDYTMGMGDNKAGGMSLGVGVVTFF